MCAALDLVLFRRFLAGFHKAVFNVSKDLFFCCCLSVLSLYQIFFLIIRANRFFYSLSIFVDAVHHYGSIIQFLIIFL